jgi:putative lipase involved disintegration of autophagic bodies
LFRQNFDGILMHCLEKDEAEKVLLELHAGEAGGHFGGDTTAHKVIKSRLLLAYPFQRCSCLMSQVCDLSKGIWTDTETSIPIATSLGRLPFSTVGPGYYRPNQSGILAAA